VKSFTIKEKKEHEHEYVENFDDCAYEEENYDLNDDCDSDDYDRFN